MDALFQHPWIVLDGFSDWLKRTIRDSMQTSAKALACDAPPKWIVTLSEAGFDYQAHTQLTVTDSVEISIHGDAHDGPLSCVLGPSQSVPLLGALDNCTESTIRDSDDNALDGLLGVVAIVNGYDKWCAFSQFNSATTEIPNNSETGPYLASLIRSLHRDLWSVPSGR